MSPIAFVVVLGNAVVLLGAMFAAGRWFRNWLIKTVSEPVEELKKTVTTTHEIAHEARLQAQRANDRYDKHLEGHHNA